KRVVALPGEDLRIFQGDLFTRPACEPDFEFQIARKPPEQVLAMRQRVHDTHHEPRSLADAGWPLAWSGEDWVVQRREATVNGAEVVQPAYQIDDRQTEARDSKATRWLRYRHTSPSEAVWRAVLGEGDPPTDGFDPSPSLITDFTPYNTRLNLSQVAQQGELTLRPRRRRPDDLGRIGVHWVGDLIVEADVVIDSAGGEVSLELVEAGDHYGVTIDVATGDATFWRQAFESAERETLAEASTPVRGQRSHRLQLANVDSRLLLWIDGDLIEADASYTTELADAEGPAEQPRSSDADAGDLAPAGLGVAGAAVRVERLRLWRDGYYLATRWDEPNLGVTTDLPPTSFEALDRANWDGSLASVATDPRLWYALGNRRSADFSVGEDQLFVLGDNSGWSLDARLWAGGNQRDAGRPGGPYLERSQLVGKAVCVYWPHAWYSLPFTNRMIPAWPNFGDMRLVR
ncbi:MAG: S26 family signal peptidase, partial [Planctomycetota bacterium]